MPALHSLRAHPWQRRTVTYWSSVMRKQTFFNSLSLSALLTHFPKSSFSDTVRIQPTYITVEPLKCFPVGVKLCTLTQPPLIKELIYHLVTQSLIVISCIRLEFRRSWFAELLPGFLHKINFGSKRIWLCFCVKHSVYFFQFMYVIFHLVWYFHFKWLHDLLMLCQKRQRKRKVMFYNAITL